MVHLKELRRYLGFGLLVLVIVVLVWLRISFKPGTDSGDNSLPSISVTPKVKIDISLRKLIVPASNVSLSEKTIITYSGPVFTAPSALTSYTSGKLTETSESEARKYANLFNLESEPSFVVPGTQGQPLFFWKDGEVSFSVGGSFPVIQYNNFVESDLSATLPTEEEIIDRATRELVRLGINNADTDNPVIEYYKQEVEAVEVKRFSLQHVSNREEATHFGVGFNYRLEGYSVFAETYPRPPIYIVFDRNFDIYSFTAILVNLSPLVESVSIPAFNEALDNLETRGILFSANARENINEETAEIYTLKSIDFRTARLAYFLPTSYIERVIPVYVFEGVGTEVSDNSEVEVVVVLPIN